MTLLPSLQLLEQLLTGHQLSADELDNLIFKSVREDQYLDYKHGDLLKGKNPNETIREYASAFANSDGGTLVIGVNESGGIPTDVTGCHDHNKGKLDEWASRCLAPIASHFAPPPRFQVVKHSNGDILVCVVQRSLNLVPITENGGIVYYFRLHDQTLKAPDYFMADLLLGRRQQPIIEIEEFKTLDVRRILDNENNSMDLSFDIAFRIVNASVVWANDSQWGIICWTQYPNLNPYLEQGKPSRHLLSYLEVKNNAFLHPKPKELVHYRGPATISKPFDSSSQRANIIVPLRFNNNWFSYTWKAALYFITRNSLPIWYQIEFTIDTNIGQLEDKQKQLIFPQESFSIRRLTTERPVIAWEEKM